MSLQFNEISGADKETDIESIDKQLGFVLDESRELKEAVNNYYLTFTEEGEIVKEALDVLVTIVGLLQKMQNRGYDVESAADEVGTNNLSKYPKQHSDAMQSLQDLAMQGVNAYVAFNPLYNCYVIRDVETGKVRKPSNYVKVNSDNFKKG